MSALDLQVTITRSSPVTVYYLRASKWTWQMKKALAVTSLPGDLVDGKPRRLGIDFGGLTEIITVFGRLKISDRDVIKEPLKFDIVQAVKTWWVDTAKQAWQGGFVSLQIADDVIFSGILSYIRFDRDAGQDDWFDYTLRFLARERLNSNIVV